MKKIVFTFFLFCSIYINAQSFNIGSNLNLGTGLDIINFGGGLELSLGYNAMENLEVKTSGGFFISSMKADVLVSGDSYTLFYAEGGFLYKLLNSSNASIYAGAGGGYYFPGKNQTGNHSFDSNIYDKSNFKEKPGFYILTGIRFSPYKIFSLNFEIKFLSLYTEHMAYYSETDSNDTFKVKTNLSTLTGKFGFIVNI